MKFVYLLKAQESGRYKIGISGKPINRKRQIQTGSNEEIILIESYPSKYANKIETALHNMYNYSNIIGEWFELRLEDEINFIDNCKKIENNIKILIENKNIFI